MWQIVANLEFVTGFAIDLQTRKPNISPRVRAPQKMLTKCYIAVGILLP